MDNVDFGYTPDHEVLHGCLLYTSRCVSETAPALLGVEGCGTTTAAALVVAAGDNPGRLKGEAAFSMMCGCLLYTSRCV